MRATATAGGRRTGHRRTAARAVVGGGVTTATDTATDAVAITGTLLALVVSVVGAAAGLVGPVLAVTLVLVALLGSLVLVAGLVLRLGRGGLAVLLLLGTRDEHLLRRRDAVDGRRQDVPPVRRVEDDTSCGFRSQITVHPVEHLDGDSLFGELQRCDRGDE